MSSELYAFVIGLLVWPILEYVAVPYLKKVMNQRKEEKKRARFLDQEH